MKYLPNWSLGVWATLALLIGSSVACLSPAWAADQKPLVINPTTGKQEQMQTGNNLLIPGTSTLTVSSLTSGRIPFASTAGLVTDSANLTFGSSNRVIGVRRTPHTWGSNYAAVEFQNTAFAEYYAASNTQFGFFGNCYDTGAGSFKYNNTDPACLYRGFPETRLFMWQTAPSGTTGTAITFVEAMRLDNTALTVASGVRGLFSDTTDSTSKDTGSIVAEGGIGSEKAVTTGTNFIAGVAGGGLLIKEGSNAKMGVATLVGGTVTVNTTAVTANSRIYLTSQADGGTVGFQRISARVAATSFTITSSSGTDTSTVAWMIVEPAP